MQEGFYENLIGTILASFMGFYVCETITLAEFMNVEWAYMQEVIYVSLADTDKYI